MANLTYTVEEILDIAGIDKYEARHLLDAIQDHYRGLRSWNADTSVPVAIACMDLLSVEEAKGFEIKLLTTAVRDLIKYHHEEIPLS